MSFITTLSMVARELFAKFFLDYVFLSVYIIIILLVKTYYERQAGLQAHILGRSSKTVREMVEETILYGLVIGFAGSVMIVYTGVALKIDSIGYLLGITAVLALINIRFVCLAYSTGVLGIIGLVLNNPDIDVTSLLLLTAIVHVLESLLIFFSSRKDSIPVFLKHGDGIIGAFFVQKYWPLPVVVLTVLTGGHENSLGSYAIRSWWPAFMPEGIGIAALALVMDCVIAVVGYSNLAVTKLPEKKGIETALQIFLYSMVLLVIGIISTHIYLFKIIGVVVSIAGHEGIIIYGSFREKHGKPAFDAVKRGVRVLDVLTGSHAGKMGIKRGDIILSINGRNVQTEEGIKHILKEFPTFVWLNCLDVYGNEKNCEYKCYPYGMDELGILVVPREKEVTYNIEYLENLMVIKNLVARFRGIGQ